MEVAFVRPALNQPGLPRPTRAPAVADQQFTPRGVARTELVGSLDSHVTPPNPRRDAAQLVQIGAQLDRAFDHDETERGRWSSTHKQRIRITTERLTLDRARA